jgi:hypothetical protein
MFLTLSFMVAARANVREMWERKEAKVVVRVARQQRKRKPSAGAMRALFLARLYDGSAGAVPSAGE